MSNLETGIAALAQRAVDSVIEEIAKDGVKVLRQVLEDEGFSHNEYLKDYEVFAHVSPNNEIWYEIVCDMEALDDESKEDLEEESDNQIPEGSKTFGYSDLGRISQLVSTHDGRRDARKPTRDATHDARREPKHLRSTYKTGEIRSMEHKIIAHSPRNLRLNPKTSKVSLRIKSMVQNRLEDQMYIYRHKKFEGAIERFINKLTKVIAEDFAAELQKIISRYTS
jgi:hypothetical protein